jgi:GntR family transcriptional regulator
MNELRRQDAVPLYHQLFLALRDEIVSGGRPDGAAVPTEHALSARFGVSRITAKRALDELAEHGLVERRRRIGTRVTYKAALPPIEANIDQAVESLLAFGRNTEVRVSELGLVEADEAVAKALQVAPGQQVLRAVRIRLHDRLPLGRITSFTAAALAPLLTRRALTRTPMLELLRSSGSRIGSGRQTVSALSADPDLAAALDLELRAAVLRIERQMFDVSGRPLLLTVAHYRADRYHLSVDLQGGPRPEPG